MSGDKRDAEILAVRHQVMVLQRQIPGQEPTHSRPGMNVEFVPHLFTTGSNRPSGQRGLYAWWRVGADSVNDLAFRLKQNQT